GSEAGLGSGGAGGGGPAGAGGGGGGGGTSTNSKPTSGTGFGAGGGGASGAWPVVIFFFRTTVVLLVGSSRGLAFMPFRRSNTVFCSPLILKTVPSGTLYCLFSPLSRVRMTLFALTYQTLPLMVLTVFTVCGVSVVVIVCCNLIPGFRSFRPIVLPSMVNVASFGTTKFFIVHSYIF